MSNRPRITSTHITKFMSLKGNKEPEDEISKDIEFPQSMQMESLVPIKLNIEQDGKQLKDMFVWDKQEPYLSLDYFSKILAEEHNLPQSFEPEIAKYVVAEIDYCFLSTK